MVMFGKEKKEKRNVTESIEISEFLKCIYFFDVFSDMYIQYF